jgi:hypothetical protein
MFGTELWHRPDRFLPDPVKLFYVSLSSSFSPSDLPTSLYEIDLFSETLIVQFVYVG